MTRSVKLQRCDHCHVLLGLELVRVDLWTPDVCRRLCKRCAALIFLRIEQAHDTALVVLERMLRASETGDAR